MKKVKMMFLSLALVAVVGGALAFKARFDKTFCTAQPNSGSCAEACPTKTSAVKIDPLGTQNLVCTTTYDNNNCATPGLQCTDIDPVSLIVDGGSGK